MASSNQKPKPESFQFALSKTAVSQICHSIGFRTAQNSALVTLTEIATRYLQTLAKSASKNANSSGRTQCNLFDVIVAIEELNSVQGFAGASNMKKPLLRSSTLRELMGFVESVDEIPFAHPIRRSFSKKARIEPTFKKLGQDPPGKHIPAWLPVFPDPRSYKDCGSRVRIRVFEEEEREMEDEDVKPNGSCEEEKGKLVTRFLPMEREKVRLKLGLGFREKYGELGRTNGICRGGKRVFLCSGGDEEERFKGEMDVD